MLKELELICQNNALDVEFAITQDHSLVIFQVRPLIIHCKKILNPDFLSLTTFLKAENNNQSRLLGAKRIYGIMPDWNPAELLGIRPKPLALSIFQELISNNIWAESRYQYGYRDVRNIPLIHSFGGQPYVDVMASFNSFIPRELENPLAEKLINYYLNTLQKHPLLHDKVEIEIVLSCFTFDLSNKLDQLQEEIPTFSKLERTQLEESLKNLTNRITHFEKGLWRASLQELSILRQKYQQVASCSADLLTKMRCFLCDGKNYGTLPFAGIARSAFIALQMLRSLLKMNIIDQSTYCAFLQNLQTIRSQLTDDLYLLSKRDFLKKYGHLRPGTYDILSQRYDEAADIYFDFSKRQISKKPKEPPFSLTLQQIGRINQLLQKHRIQHTAKTLFSFFADAIRGRELAKFMFTKNVSAILKLVEEYGQRYGIDRKECAFLNITDILHISSRPDQTLKYLVEEGKEKYALSERLYLPPLIFDETDLFSFHLFEQKPNFITLKRICAPKTEIDDDNIKGKIVFIHSADPGYDWIFSKQIAGFITCYGGVNSHMAIRAAELNLPAIIGAGQSLFLQWRQHKILDIDCANKKVIPIK